jgi:uncharacterized YigZ family protein
MNEYLFPTKRAQGEFIEKKSRFIGSVCPTESQEEALAFLKEIRNKYPDANHHVYAYSVLEGGFCRHSDDSEPSGTGGLPLLGVFARQSVQNFCAVATRYFGGVLLGAPGLTRAYAKCGVVALEASGLSQMRVNLACQLLVRYSQYESVSRLLESMDSIDIQPEFGENVLVRFSCPIHALTEIRTKVLEMTGGQACIENHGEILVPVPI